MCRVAGLAECLDAWDMLARQCAEPNPFYESWYLRPSLECLGAGRSVRLLCVEAGGRLIGLLPLVHQRRYYGRPIPNLSNWVHDNCFLGVPMIAAGMERLFWRALLDWADAHCGAAVFLHLRAMPLASPVTDALIEACGEQDREIALVHREERALLRSDLSPGAYFDAALSGKKRKELRRQAARLGELGDLRFIRQRDAEGISPWCEAFLGLEQSGWKGRAGSALLCATETAALFRRTVAGAARRDKLERLTLTLNGHPIAMLASFLAPPGAFSFKTAYDEDYARFSPGVLLQRENLAMLEDPDIAWTDSCAAADHPMIDHIWRERRAIGRFSVAIGGSIRQRLFHMLAARERKADPGGYIS